jgi:hypothetical protein
VRKEESNSSFSKLTVPHESLESGTRFVTMYKGLRKLFAVVGCEDITLTDLIFPEPRRIKILLSEVINFCKMRDRIINEYRAIIDERVRPY